MDMENAAALPLLGGHGESSKSSRSIAFRALSSLYNHKHNIAIALGPLAAALILAFLRIERPVANEDNRIVPMLSILAWVCIWWVTEAVPVAITSLIPLMLFPLFKIMKADTVATSYMNDTITLFIGSFLLALAVERYKVHKRLALKTLLFFGGESMEPRRLLLGFCVGPAFVSMWISNTATAIMMMPMSAGVLKRLNERTEDLVTVDEQLEGIEIHQDHAQNVGNKATSTCDPDPVLETDQLSHITDYARAVVLAIGYSVSIGGLSTLTGTGTNLVLLGIWSSCFPTVTPVSYLQWFMFGFPLGLLLLAFCWGMLCFCYCPRAATPAISRLLNRSSIEDELKSLGKMSFSEATVLILFSVLAALWMTRSLGTMSGWGKLFNGFAADGTVSVLVALFLFIIPNKIVPGEMLMDWSHCKKLPWDIVLLFGGGFALADGIKASGLSAWVTQYLSFLELAPFLLITPIVVIFVSLTTEFTSNNATATIFLPLLAEAALSNKLHPLFLMVTGTIAASFAFMLPIATPPNAVAFSTGHVRMIDMISTGFMLKCCGIVLLSILMPTLGTYVFQLDKPFNI